MPELINQEPARKLAEVKNEKKYVSKHPCVKDASHQFRYTKNFVCVECTNIRDRAKQAKLKANPKNKKKNSEQKVNAFKQKPYKITIVPPYEPTLKELMANLRFPTGSKDNDR